MSYRFLEHTADVKFRADGLTIEEMFSSAAGALFETIRGEIKILELVEESFEVTGTDMASLLYSFLEEFLFLLDAKNFLMSSIKSIEVDESNFKIRCSVLGDEAEKYKFTNDVKAVTYNDMFVEKKDGKFVCQVVLDV